MNVRLTHTQQRKTFNLESWRNVYYQNIYIYINNKINVCPTVYLVYSAVIIYLRRSECDQTALFLFTLIFLAR